MMRRYNATLQGFLSEKCFASFDKNVWKLPHLFENTPFHIVF